MNTFKVLIEEKREKIVEIKAEDEISAIIKVYSEYAAGRIILGTKDIKTSDVVRVPAVTKEE